MFGLCAGAAKAGELGLPPQGLLIFMNGVTAAGKSSFGYRVHSENPVVMELTHNAHKLPSGMSLSGLSKGELEETLWCTARVYAQYGRTVMVETNQPDHFRLRQHLCGSPAYCVLLVFCNLQDLPQRVHGESVSHRDLCIHIVRALVEFGIYFGPTGRLAEAPLQKLSRSDVLTTLHSCFKLMRTNSVRDMDIQIGLDILRDFLLNLFGLAGPSPPAAVPVFPRLPYDAVLNASQFSAEKLVQQFPRMVATVQSPGYRSVLDSAGPRKSLLQPFSCDQCGAVDFAITGLPCSACLAELRRQLERYGADAAAEAAQPPFPEPPRPSAVSSVEYLQYGQPLWGAPTGCHPQGQPVARCQPAMSTLPSARVEDAADVADPDLLPVTHLSHCPSDGSSSYETLPQPP